MQPKTLDPDTLDIEELKQRFLVVQAVEAARTVEDHVITDPREADVGSILGFGFAPFTGGTLSYIDFMGTKKFVELCHKLEAKYGSALHAAETAGRHGGQRRDVLWPLPAEEARGGLALARARQRDMFASSRLSAVAANTCMLARRSALPVSSVVTDCSGPETAMQLWPGASP